jgi:hypothetical protein
MGPKYSPDRPLAWTRRSRGSRPASMASSRARSSCVWGSGRERSSIGSPRDGSSRCTPASTPWAIARSGATRPGGRCAGGRRGHRARMPVGRRAMEDAGQRRPRGDLAAQGVATGHPRPSDRPGGRRGDSPRGHPGDDAGPDPVRPRRSPDPRPAGARVQTRRTTAASAARPSSMPSSRDTPGAEGRPASDASSTSTERSARPAPGATSSATSSRSSMPTTCRVRMSTASRTTASSTPRGPRRSSSSNSTGGGPSRPTARGTGRS